MAKQVRTIKQKLADIAEGGPHAERRIDRLTGQLEKLAVVAIQARYMLSDARMIEIVAAPNRDEILAEAVVGNWIAVSDLVNTALFNATHALYGPDPLAG